MEDTSCREDGGFILLETMIALTLITTVMAAVGMQYVSSIAASSYQRSAATAAQLASSRMSELRAMNPTDLLRGRTAVAVGQQQTRMEAVTKVGRWVTDGDKRLAFDNDTSKTNVIPTVAVPRVVGSRTYSIDVYFECREDATAVLSGMTPVRRDCLTATDATSTNSLRAVVAVTWTGQTCESNTCAFVTSSIIDPHANPTFELNQELPPVPVIDSVPAQTVVVGDVYERQLTVKDGTGAAPFSWSIVSGTLPGGLTLSPTGSISALNPGDPTVKGPTGTRSVTVRVTDAFFRQSSKDVSITFSVQPPLSLAAVSNQTSVVNQSATGFKLSPSGGSGGYRFDAAGSLPPGIAMDAEGNVSGKPTRAGTYSVVLTVTDSRDRTASVNFTWTVGYPPIVPSDPGPQTSTLGFDDGVTLTASGGTEDFRWGATGLPAGLTLDPETGKISGRPTGPVTGTGTPASVVATATDRNTGSQQSVRFSWRIYAAPTITAPAAQKTTKGVGVDFDVTYTCPSGGCTIRFENQPNGVTVNDRGEVSGTVASNATGSTAVRLKIADATGATVSSTDFAWTVHERPTWSTIPSQTSSRRASVSFPTAAYVTQGNVPYIYTASGLPAGLTIDGASGVVSGTTANTNSRSGSVVITVRDQSGVTVASSAFSWNVSNLAMPIDDQTGARNKSMTFAVKATGGTSPYTFSGTGFPAGFSASQNGDTVTITGTPQTSGAFTPTFRVTDSQGATVSTTFKITVT